MFKVRKPGHGFGSWVLTDMAYSVNNLIRVKRLVLIEKSQQNRAKLTKSFFQCPKWKAIRTVRELSAPITEILTWIGELSAVAVAVTVEA